VVEYHHMNKETKLVNKVKHLLKKAGLPRWLHKFGPKKYEFWHHALALVVKSMCKLSFRRVVSLLRGLGFECPAKSTLHDTTKKIPTIVWQRLLKATIPIKTYIGALDSTGFSRTNPSYHYLKRINRVMPRVPIKLSAIVDTKHKKFLDAKIRVLPAHDIKDLRSLVTKSNIKKLVADKAYDAEWVHELCYYKEIESHIPLRKWSKGRWRNMGYRISAQKRFNKKTYHRRSIIESLFYALKTTLGSYTNNKSAKTIKAEMYLRLITYNIFLVIWRLRTGLLFP